MRPIELSDVARFTMSLACRIRFAARTIGESARRDPAGTRCDDRHSHAWPGLVLYSMSHNWHGRGGLSALARIPTAAAGHVVLTTSSIAHEYNAGLGSFTRGAGFTKPGTFPRYPYCQG